MVQHRVSPSSKFFFLLFVLVGLGCWLARISSFPRSFNWEFFAFPFAIAIPVVLALEFIKIIGRFDCSTDIDETDSAAEALQFGMGHLFLAVTVSAILFAFQDSIVSIARDSSDGGFPILLFSIVMILMTVLSVWAQKRVATPIRLLISFLLSAGMVFVVGKSILRSNDGFDLLFATLFGGNWLAMTLLLMLLRRSGYRFEKNESRHLATHPVEAVSKLLVTRRVSEEQLTNALFFGPS